MLYLADLEGGGGGVVLIVYDLTWVFRPGPPFLMNLPRGRWASLMYSLMCIPFDYLTLSFQCIGFHYYVLLHACLSFLFCCEKKALIYVYIHWTSFVILISGFVNVSVFLYCVFFWYTGWGPWVQRDDGIIIIGRGNYEVCFSLYMCMYIHRPPPFWSMFSHECV